MRRAHFKRHAVAFSPFLRRPLLRFPGFHTLENMRYHSNISIYSPSASSVPERPLKLRGRAKRRCPWKRGPSEQPSVQTRSASLYTHTSHTHSDPGSLPGRPGSRCPPPAGGRLPPHRRHLGVFRAAVQVRELLQLRLPDLVVVVLHREEKHRVHTHLHTHTHTHSDSSGLAFNYTVLNSVLYLQGYSPGNI